MRAEAGLLGQFYDALAFLRGEEAWYPRAIDILKILGLGELLICLLENPAELGADVLLLGLFFRLFWLLLRELDLHVNPDGVLPNFRRDGHGPCAICGFARHLQRADVNLLPGFRQLASAVHGC